MVTWFLPVLGLRCSNMAWQARGWFSTRTGQRCGAGNSCITTSPTPITIPPHWLVWRACICAAWLRPYNVPGAFYQLLILIIPSKILHFLRAVHLSTSPTLHTTSPHTCLLPSYPVISRATRATLRLSFHAAALHAAAYCAFVPIVAPGCAADLLIMAPSSRQSLSSSRSSPPPLPLCRAGKDGSISCTLCTLTSCLCLVTWMWRAYFSLVCQLHYVLCCLCLLPSYLFCLPLPPQPVWHACLLVLGC